MGAKVIVSSDLLTSSAADAKRMGEELSDAVKEYLRIMQFASGKGLKSGSAATNLRTFIGYAQSLDGKLDAIGSEVDSIVKKFTEQTEADDHFSF